MSTATELDDLRGSLRKALRTPPVDVAPQPDPAWRVTWPALAELGVTGFCVAEDLGGFGMEVAAAVVAARELGGVLHGSPFAAHTAASFAISRGLDAAPRSATVAPLVSGADLVTLAKLTPGGSLVDVPAGVRIDGHARLVAGGAEAESVVVVAPDGDRLVLVPRAACGVTPSGHAFDVTRSFSDVRFDGATGVSIAADATTRETTIRLHNLLVAADALGGVERMLERTTAYARTRTAFGRPIGGFQAVQHRLVDHTLRVRGLSLLVEAAARDLATGAGRRRALLAEAAVATHAVHILHDLLQLTGAIGFTWEHGLHLYERRAHLDARVTQNPRAALGSLAADEGWLSMKGATT